MSHKIMKQKRTKLTPFSVNQVIEEANVKVLKVLEVTTRTIDTFYYVEYLCCHREDKLSHAQIRKRMNTAARKVGKEPLKCKQCDLDSREGRDCSSGYKEEPLKIPLPTWPTPQQLRKHHA